MKNIASALVKAQRAFGPALKTNTNPHFKSKYADLSACVEAVVDALNAEGIFLMQRTMEDAVGVTVETLFLHESGESMSSGPLHVPAAKHDPQGYGSALTYARRYSLMAACGIAPEDDDGNAATKRNPAVSGVANAVLAVSDPIDAKRMEYLAGFAADLIDEFQNGRTFVSIVDAINAEKLDDTELIYLSTKVPSNMRNGIKEEMRARRKVPA